MSAFLYLIFLLNILALKKLFVNSFIIFRKVGHKLTYLLKNMIFEINKATQVMNVAIAVIAPIISSFLYLLCTNFYFCVVYFILQ